MFEIYYINLINGNQIGINDILGSFELVASFENYNLIIELRKLY